MSAPEDLMSEYDKLLMNARATETPFEAPAPEPAPPSAPAAPPIFDTGFASRQPTASGLRLGSLIEESGPPIVDRDVERLSEQLDQMSNMFKREVMGSFLDTKNLLLAKQTEILDAERRQNAALLGKKQDEIEMYKEKLALALRECERQLLIIEQMGEFLALKGEQKDGGMVLARCFGYWKEELVASRHSKMISRWPEPHYNKALQRRFLGEWRDETRLGRREAVDQFWQGKMESMSTSIVAEYENQLAAMQAELLQASKQLEEERASRSKLYDDLMSQFRRGVCAFNLEALAALKPEDEPVPAPVPLRARTVSERNAMQTERIPAKSVRRVGLSAGVRSDRGRENEHMHGVVRSVRDLEPPQR